MIIDDFLRYMQTEKVASPITITSYRLALNDFSRFVATLDGQQLETVDSDVIREWLSMLMEQGRKASTVCRQLSAVKSMYRYALSHGLVAKDPAHLVRGPKKQKPLPVILKEAEADALFDRLEWDDGSFADVRARTILLLLYSTGARRAEAVALDDSDISLVNKEVKFTGKRRKQRIVPLTDELASQVRHYLQARDASVARVDDAFLVGDKGARITPSQVYGIVRKYLSLVTTAGKRSPHVLRHSFATAMLNHDARLGSVQKLLGHESVATTEIYTHVTFEDLKRVYNNAHPRALPADETDR